MFNWNINISEGLSIWCISFTSMTSASELHEQNPRFSKQSQTRLFMYNKSLQNITFLIIYYLMQYKGYFHGSLIEVFSRIELRSQRTTN